MDNMKEVEKAHKPIAAKSIKKGKKTIMDHFIVRCVSVSEIERETKSFVSFSQ